MHPRLIAGLCVSILAQPGGRALRARGDREPGLLPSVSILAQPGGRALPAPTDSKEPIAPSVSILAQPGGRALRNPDREPTISCCSFNPRPARGPGAACQEETPGFPGKVSILAQPGGRALPEGIDLVVGGNFAVSILAQPGGRALHRNTTMSLDSAVQVSILAQPGGRALLDSTSGLSSDRTRFQSSPSPGAGRCFRAAF